MKCKRLKSSGGKDKRKDGSGGEKGCNERKNEGALL